MPMFSFMCHFYPAYKLTDWLKIPIKTFFSMHREAIKIEARQFAELADIQLISNNMKLEYYLDLKNRYRSIINPEKPKLPPKPGGAVLESGSKEAMSVMKDMGFAMRRNFGYGR